MTARFAADPLASLAALRWTALSLAAVTLMLSGVLAALGVPVGLAEAERVDAALATGAAPDGVTGAGDARAPLGAFTGILAFLTVTSLTGSGLVITRHVDGARTLAAVGLLAAAAWGVTRVTTGPDADAWHVLARVTLLVALPAALLVLANGTHRALTRRLLGAGAVVAVATTLLAHAWWRAWSTQSADAVRASWSPLEHTLRVSLPDVGYAVAVVLYASVVLLVLHEERTRDAAAS